MAAPPARPGADLVVQIRSALAGAGDPVRAEGQQRYMKSDDLLLRAVEANLDDPSFWLRKGIGWGLRDYARTDPVWVSAQVDRLGDRLSALSRKEATKHRTGP